MTAKRIELERFGGPDVLNLVPFETQEPCAGQALVRHTAIGVNYIDIFQRLGFGAEPLPARLGLEAVGVIEQIQHDGKGFKPGDTVAYVTAGPGAYATHNTVDVDKLVPCPEDIPDQQIAAGLFKGLTAQYLIKTTATVSQDDVVVVQAASGGVGQLLVQWCKALGATVIGSTSSAQKAPCIVAAGADAVHILGDNPLTETVIETTQGRMANVVFDSVGRATFEDSFACLGMFGKLVMFGAASGPPPPIKVDDLYSRGLFVTRPSVFHHISSQDGLLERSRDVFNAIRDEMIAPKVAHTYELEAVAEAHRALQSRKTQGSVILTPEAQ